MEWSIPPSSFTAFKRTAAEAPRSSYKVAPPFRKAEFDIMFGEGISHSGEIIDLGADLGIIKKSGSWYSYNDTKLGQGRDAAKQCIADNPELAEELEGLIFEKLREHK